MGVLIVVCIAMYVVFLRAYHCGVVTANIVTKFKVCVMFFFKQKTAYEI